LGPFPQENLLLGLLINKNNLSPAHPSPSSKLKKGCHFLVLDTNGYRIKYTTSRNKSKFSTKR